MEGIMRSTFLLSVALLVIQTLPIKSIAVTTSSPTCHKVTCSPPCEPDIWRDNCYDVCACPKTCLDADCKDSETCILQEVECFRAPCFKIPTCVPRKENELLCPRIVCIPGCRYVVNEYSQCLYCACPQECKEECSENEKCMLTNHICTETPCLPLPTCVPKNDYCLAVPNQGSDCGSPVQRWTYNTSENACYQFTYNGCTLTENTFLTLSQCNKKCKAVALVCPDIPCPDECYTFTRPQRCPVCICPNPCENFDCNSNEECKVHETECTHISCKLTPYCAKKCPIQLYCDKDCRWGFKKDENECTLCECLEFPNGSS